VAVLLFLQLLISGQVRLLLHRLAHLSHLNLLGHILDVGKDHLVFNVDADSSGGERLPWVREDCPQVSQHCHSPDSNKVGP